MPDYELFERSVAEANVVRQQMLGFRDSLRLGLTPERAASWREWCRLAAADLEQAEAGMSAFLFELIDEEVPEETRAHFLEGLEHIASGREVLLWAEQALAELARARGLSDDGEDSAG